MRTGALLVVRCVAPDAISASSVVADIAAEVVAVTTTGEGTDSFGNVETSLDDLTSEEVGRRRLCRSSLAREGGEIGLRELISVRVVGVAMAVAGEAMRSSKSEKALPLPLPLPVKGSDGELC